MLADVFQPSGEAEAAEKPEGRAPPDNRAVATLVHLRKMWRFVQVSPTRVEIEKTDCPTTCWEPHEASTEWWVQVEVRPPVAAHCVFGLCERRAYFWRGLYRVCVAHWEELQAVPAWAKVEPGTAFEWDVWQRWLEAKWFAAEQQSAREKRKAGADRRAAAALAEEQLLEQIAAGLQRSGWIWERPTDAGAADFWALVPLDREGYCVPLALQVRSAKGRAAEQQLEWQKVWESCGCVYRRVASLDGARSAIVYARGVQTPRRAA